MEIETDDNYIVGVWRKLGPFVSSPFQIDLLDRDVCEVPLLGRRSKFREALSISIDCLDFESMAGQIQRVASASAGHIQRAAFGQAMKLLCDEAGRSGLD